MFSFLVKSQACVPCIQMAKYFVFVITFVFPSIVFRIISRIYSCYYWYMEHGEPIQCLLYHKVFVRESLWCSGQRAELQHCSKQVQTPVMLLCSLSDYWLNSTIIVSSTKMTLAFSNPKSWICH